MEQNKNVIIALAVFSIVLLIGYDYQRVYAVSASDFTFGSVNNNVFYQEEMSTFVTLEQSSSATASARLCFLDAQSESPSTEQNCVTIFPQQGGCDVDPSDGINYNPCSATIGTTDCDTDFIGADPCSNKTGLTGLFQGLWCGTTYCFILFDQSTGGWSSQLIRVWSLGVGSSLTGDVSGYRNITSTWSLATSTWGFDECNGTNCGIGGITFFWASDKASTSWVVHKEGGTSLMGTVAELDTLIADASGPIRSLEGCRHCGGVVGTTTVFVSAPWNSGASRQIQVLNAVSMASIATYGTTSLNSECTGSGVGGATTTSAGQAVYMGDTINRYAYNVDTGMIFVHAVTGAIDPTDCIPKASFSIIDFVRGIAIDEENDLWYIWHGSGQTLGSITQLNLTSYALIADEVDFDPADATISDTISGWVDGGMPYQSMDVAFDFGTILMTSDSAKARLLYLNNFQSVDTPTDGCAENPETVFCRLGGTNDNQTSGIGGMVGDGIVALGCNIAFVDCVADDNPATNGLGLLIFIASVFVVVGMFYWSIGNDSFKMPLFIWVLIIISLSAFFTIIGLIDPVFLVISIVAIVALAAPKVLSSLKGSTFGGGSTE